MRVSSCGFHGDPVPPERSHHSFNPSKIITTVQREHFSQHTVDKECLLFELFEIITPCLFSFQDGMSTLLISCSRDFIALAFNIKRHQNTKEPQNSRSLGRSGLEAGNGQVMGLLIKAANSHHIAIVISLYLTPCCEEAHGGPGT